MPENEMQVRVSPKRSLDLQGQIIHHFQQRRIRLGLIGDERAAEFEEDKFFHGSIVI